MWHCRRTSLFLEGTPPCWRDFFLSYPATPEVGWCQRWKDFCLWRHQNGRCWVKVGGIRKKFARERHFFAYFFSDFWGLFLQFPDFLGSTQPLVGPISNWDTPYQGRVQPATLFQPAQTLTWPPSPGDVKRCLIDRSLLTSGASWWNFFQWPARISGHEVGKIFAPGARQKCPLFRFWHFLLGFLKLSQKTHTKPHFHLGTQR